MQVAPVGSAGNVAPQGSGEKAQRKRPQGQAPAVKQPPVPVSPKKKQKRAESSESSDSSSASSSVREYGPGTGTLGTGSTSSSSTGSSTSTTAISRRGKKGRKKARKEHRGKEKPGFPLVGGGSRKGSSSSWGTGSSEEDSLKLWVFPATAIILTILIAGAITLMLEPVDSSSSSSSYIREKVQSIEPKKAEDDCPCRAGKNNTTTTTDGGTTSSLGSTDAVPGRGRLPSASTPRAQRTKAKRKATTVAVDDGSVAGGRPEDVLRRSGVEGGENSSATSPRGHSGPKNLSFNTNSTGEGRRKLGAKKAAGTPGRGTPSGSWTQTTSVVGTVTKREVDASRPEPAAELQPTPEDRGASEASTKERRSEPAAEGQPRTSSDVGRKGSVGGNDTQRPLAEDEGRLGEAPAPSGDESNATQTDSRRVA